MREAFRIFVQQSWSYGGVECYITKREELSQKTSIAKSLEWEIVDVNGLMEPREPTLRFTAEQAQELADSLWRMGFRPKDASATQGHLQSMEAHIKDLQRLVFEHSDGIKPAQ